MSPERVKEVLQALARQWRRKLFLRQALRSCGVSLVLSTAFSTMMRWSFSSGAVFCLFCFVVMLAFLVLKQKNTSIDSDLIARHLNRTMPEVEESCGLFLKSDATLTVVEKMQRDRVLQVMSDVQKRLMSPAHAMRRAWVFALCSFVSALLLALTAPYFSTRLLRPEASGLTPDKADEVTRQINFPLRIEEVRIEINPPAYTRKSPRAQNQYDVQIEEGGEARWRLSLNQSAKTGLLILNDTDTLMLAQSASKAYTGQREMFESGFYYLQFDQGHGESLQSEYHRIEVMADVPPAIEVIEPAQKTEIVPGFSNRIELQAVVKDDYGVASADLIATVAHGTGEAVKFRDVKLPFDAIEKISLQRWNVRKEIELRDLGMTPGDELYFYLESLDNREPVANRSRSETFFITIKDTAAQMLTASTGLLINPMPEYFRSQRQIIIDTEKLIEERAHLSDAEFKRRSNNVGLDQQALRFRYGQFLGDDLEGESAVTEERHADENGENPVEHLIHSHDAEDNATLFAPSIKAQLKAALAEMWQAELHLRTYKPTEALPYEYRALDLLKDVQQRSRLYVQRVGFEPAPIKVDEKRLTGDLSSIEGQRMKKQTAEEESMPEVRRALGLVQGWKSLRLIVDRSDLQTLERAGQELARRAMEEPGRHLAALRDLRTLIADARSGKKIREESMLAAERAFWRILPHPEVIPPTYTKPAPSSALSVGYFNRLGAQR